MLDKITMPRSVFTSYDHLLSPVDFKVWMHIFNLATKNQTADSDQRIHFTSPSFSRLAEECTCTIFHCPLLFRNTKLSAAWSRTISFGILIS